MRGLHYMLSAFAVNSFHAVRVEKRRTFSDSAHSSSRALFRQPGSAKNQNVDPLPDIRTE